MGVRASIAAISPIAASKTQAAVVGVDVAGMLAMAQLKCQEAMQILSVLNTDVFTPASDSTASTACTTQTTALS